jgi:peptidoglycan L-alanyl-D-glutamate endopeptidase CwlK
MYRLSALSRRRLVGVHPDLTRWVEAGIALTAQDFRVQEGLRTKARQAQLVAAGASRTLDSRHLTGHAVDLVPLLGTVPRWDWPLVYQIVPPLAQAARDLNLPVIWGGAWCDLADLRSVADAEAAIAAYTAQCKRKGRRPFLDGAHFELSRHRYP